MHRTNLHSHENPIVGAYMYTHRNEFTSKQDQRDYREMEILNEIYTGKVAVTAGAYYITV